MACLSDIRGNNPRTLHNRSSSRALHFAFVGDSRVRQFFYSFLQVIALIVFLLPTFDIYVRFSRRFRITIERKRCYQKVYSMKIDSFIVHCSTCSSLTNGGQRARTLT